MGYAIRHKNVPTSVLKRSTISTRFTKKFGKLATRMSIQGKGTPSGEILSTLTVYPSRGIDLLDEEPEIVMRRTPYNLTLKEPQKSRENI